ncbi:restriction endonuclease subunit S [Rhizobium ruizarguesonis]|uniref:restriction endonuclease subunit S n=1 Tax=Rhizobium ruizarguesonis TaxID=2081791 RepID=UPI0013EEB671|nr:restriction endonuclease subunit S [Rhizobium ruizarguesonis]
MSHEAPAGWRSVRLGEVAHEDRSRNADGKIPGERLVGVFKNEGMIPMRERVKGASVDRCKIVQPGAFAYNPMRINIGSIARSAFDHAVMVSPDYVVFSANKDVLDGSFLEHLRRSVEWDAYVGNAGDGGVRIRIYFDRLAEFRFALPPLHEQRRIAEILSSVDDGIGATRAVIEQTRTVKQGVLERLLTKGIGHTRFNQTEIGEIPEGWEVVQLSEVATVRTGLAKNKKEVPDPVDLPYLRVANVQDGYIDLADLHTIRVSRTQVERYRLVAGDVLMTEGGDFDKLGRGDVWSGIVDPCLHQNHVFAVRADRARILPEFLALLTASTGGKAYFQSCSKRSTNLASINSSQVKAFPVRLPYIREQSEIVGAAEIHDATIASLETSLKKQLLLKSSLMSDLLTGRKRVTEALPMAAE